MKPISVARCVAQIFAAAWFICRRGLNHKSARCLIKTASRDASSKLCCPCTYFDVNKTCKVFQSQDALYVQSVHIYIYIHNLSLLSTFYFLKYPSWEIHVSYYTRETVTQTEPSRLVCLVYDLDRKPCKYLIWWELQSHMRNWFLYSPETNEISPKTDLRNLKAEMPSFLMVVKDCTDAQHFINVIQVAHVRRRCGAHHKVNEAYYQQIHRSSGLTWHRYWTSDNTCYFHTVVILLQCVYYPQPLCNSLLKRGEVGWGKAE